MSETNLIKCLILDDSVIYADSLRRVLTQEAGFDFHSAHTGFGEEARAVRKYSPHVILLSGDIPGVASVLETLDSMLPEIPLVVVFSEPSPQLEQECVLAGARFCLTNLEDQEEVQISLRRLALREKRRKETMATRARDEKKRAQVIAFRGAKGGVGTSTMAINTAVALAKHVGKRVIVIDAALQASDAGVLLDVHTSTNITDLIAHMKDLDADLLSEVMGTHESGVRVLLGPSNIEHAEMVTPEQFKIILNELKKQADYIVVDTPAALDAVSMASLDEADQIVLVGTPEISALRNAARFISLASKLGYSEEKLFLVLNKANLKGAIRLEDIKDHLRFPIGFKVKTYSKAMLTAINQGKPVAMNKSRFGAPKTFRQMAMTLDGRDRTIKRQQRVRVSALLRRNRQAKKSEPDMQVQTREASV